MYVIGGHQDTCLEDECISHTQLRKVNGHYLKNIVGGEVDVSVSSIGSATDLLMCGLTSLQG